MEQPVPRLSAGVLGHIFELANVSTRLQLSQCSTVWRKQWKKQLHVHLVHLLGTPSLETDVGFTRSYRTPNKRVMGQPAGGGSPMMCLTLHLHTSAAALGRFLALPAVERRVMGGKLAVHLHNLLSVISENFDWITIEVTHDARLGPQDYHSLKDLLWLFPCSQHADNLVDKALVGFVLWRPCQASSPPGAACGSWNGPTCWSSLLRSRSAWTAPTIFQD